MGLVRESPCGVRETGVRRQRVEVLGWRGWVAALRGGAAGARSSYQRTGSGCREAKPRGSARVEEVVHASAKEPYILVREPDSMLVWLCQNSRWQYSPWHPSHRLELMEDRAAAARSAAASSARDLSAPAEAAVAAAMGLLGRGGAAAAAAAAAEAAARDAEEVRQWAAVVTCANESRCAS